MKTVVAILTVVILFTFTSCKKEVDINTMMQNPEIRTQMMQKIVGNDKMMIEFMTQMKGSSQAIQMMQGNPVMMNMMMQGKGMQMMQGKMMKSPEMMKGMMQQMMKDGKMMQQMMQMMKDKGMMSEECMQSGLKMMKSKGMQMMSMNSDDHGSHKH